VRENGPLVQHALARGLAQQALGVVQQDRNFLGSRGLGVAQLPDRAAHGLLDLVVGALGGEAIERGASLPICG